MASRLSPYRLRKAREVYNSFNVFNAISWNLLVGIIITLFALRLGASSTYIGLLSSTFYAALFFLPLGKILARRFTIIGIFSTTWILRSIGMVFAVMAPFFVYAGNRSTGLFFILLGVILFQFFRGIGMIGNNPVLSSLSAGPDRGSYMTQIQIINSSIGMFGSFIVAMILGLEPPLFIFSVLLSLGIITGVISGLVIKKVPEPPREQDSDKTNLLNIFKDAFSHDSLRHFMFILFLVVMVSGVTRTFAVVYAREVFSHNDGLISLYSVFGGLGFLMAGMCIKFLVDRIGAKPLFLVCVILGTVSLIPVIFFPQTAVDNVTGSILFMVFLFFTLNFGFLGSEGIAQTYFLALIPAEKILDFGILYFFIFGAAGAAGAFLSGLLIDFLLLTGVSPFLAFKILFAAMLILAGLALAMQKRMKSLGSLSLKGALDVIFSVRDLRAISILDKLNKAEDSHEEEVLLGALHGTPSSLAIEGLLERARSPRLATRLEAISALEKMDTLTENAKKALIEDIKNNPFTTAYLSARILGNNRSVQAIPVLRELALCDDYMLAGEAINALAKMKDDEFRPEIEKLVLETKNPRLKIMGTEALGLYHSASSIPVLLDILRGDSPPPYLKDEVVLAIASILGTQKTFYRILVRCVADCSLLHALAADEAESAVEFTRQIINRKRKMPDDAKQLILSRAENFHGITGSYIKDNNGVQLSRWIIEFPEIKGKAELGIKYIFSQAALDDELSACDHLRLLIVHWAAHELRTLALKAEHIKKDMQYGKKT